MFWTLFAETEPNFSQPKKGTQPTIISENATAGTGRTVMKMDFNNRWIQQFVQLF